MAAARHGGLGVRRHPAVACVVFGVIRAERKELNMNMCSTQKYIMFNINAYVLITSTIRELLKLQHNQHSFEAD